MIMINTKKTYPMPSLNMNTKPVIGSLKEDGLRVCRRSCKISKNPLSRSRGCHDAEALYNQDASVFDKVRVLDHGGAEELHDQSCSEENVSQKYPSNQNNTTAVDSVEPLISTCVSNMATIFSPMKESSDTYNNQGTEILLDSGYCDDGRRNSSEYPGCNVSDFHISDMIFSCPSIERNSEFYNKTDTTLPLDYLAEEPGLFSDECLDLPFLEDITDSRCELGGRETQESIADAKNFSMDMEIHQIISQSHDLDSLINVFPDQDYECFDPQLYIKTQVDMPSTLSAALVPSEKQNTKRNTLVLDLDETLVHSTLGPCDDADFTFPVFINRKEYIVSVKKRPHLQTFLHRVSEMFEVVIFTASQSFYAAQILHILDPDSNVISRRAYRESCIFSEGSYVKDLTIFGVDLARVAIVDNSPQVYRLQVDNGIPILSWFDDPSDSALMSLLTFLETLAGADDVRPIIAKKFASLVWHIFLYVIYVI
ncbi:probable phosphatase PSR2 isoform X3 [Andrographis paniculata]|uniref:probable phosphatase PSR2 isoform X3 n=1 Tax=Andrographis paniculata TaxID=175694 RepID=UPI0021E96ED3|nr:probable phosphatase PSR2 isoform X3 [Andrographis paniculata]